MRNRKTEIKWGLIFTLMMILWMALEKITGLHDEHIDKHPVYTNLVAIPAILLYIFALLEKKKKDYQGSMTYVQAFVSGLIISLIVAILTPAMQYITLTWITPHYFENAIRYAVENNLSTPEEAQNYFNLKNYIIQATIGAPIMGIVTSAIIAAFVRNK